MIPIQNVYYMLSYVFQVLNEQGYKNILVEPFENTADLMAAILQKGISVQIKRGIGKDYVSETNSLSVPHGKINISDSIQPVILEKKLVCTYDNFSVNGIMNRIIKSTVDILLRSNISKKRKSELRKLMIYFADVDLIDLHNVDWNIQYNRNNQTYRMLITICFLVYKGLLQTTTDGNVKLMDFIDERNMCRLYERFILEYYRKEFPAIQSHASQIQWQLDDGMDAMLPVMQTDVMLIYEEKILIIDAKYYSRTTQSHFDRHTIHSGNLYQIFTYVKNKESELALQQHMVSGMLLYAKTDEEIQPDNTYMMSGNKIFVKTLDLNLQFEGIAQQLDNIVLDYFGLSKNTQ